MYGQEGYLKTPYCDCALLYVSLTSGIHPLSIPDMHLLSCVPRTTQVACIPKRIR
jgi:hypothetical protein